MPEGGRGKLFESIEIAERIWIEGAPMRAKPRCGHGMSFSKEREGQTANCLFEAAGSDNLASQQFHPPQQISLATCACDHRSRGSIARIRARRPWLDALAANRSNNLRAVRVGMVAALLTAGNAK